MTRHADFATEWPGLVFVDTEANIEGLGLGAGDEGAIAYASDENQPGWFDGAAWTWYQDISETGEPTFAKLTVEDVTVDTADHYYGIYNEHIKTAGATGAADDFFGFYNLTEMDQAAGEVRYLDGIVNELTFTDGEAFDLDVFYSLIDANAGTVGNSIYGGHIKLDIEAGVTVGNDIFGLYVEVDTAADPTGDVIMLYLDETAGVDYGFYQNGSAVNVLGGRLTIDQPSLTGAQPTLLLDQADLSEGFIDYVGTSAASAVGPISTWTTGNSIQGFVRVEINGAAGWMPYYDAPTS